MFQILFDTKRQFEFSPGQDLQLWRAVKTQRVISEPQISGGAIPIRAGSITQKWKIAGVFGLAHSVRGSQMLCFWKLELAP